jgi:hypothetical protein
VAQRPPLPDEELELVLPLELMLEPEVMPELVLPELFEVPEPPVDDPPFELPQATTLPAIAAAPRTKTTNPPNERISTS